MRCHCGCVCTVLHVTARLVALVIRHCHVNLPVVCDSAFSYGTAFVLLRQWEFLGKITTRLKDLIYFYDSYDTGIPMESILPHRPWQILFTSQMYGLIDKEK